jgi:hypothetical protein
MRSDPADRLRKWAPDADDYELPDLPEVVLTMIDVTAFGGTGRSFMEVEMPVDEGFHDPRLYPSPGEARRITSGSEVLSKPWPSEAN